MNFVKEKLSNEADIIMGQSPPSAFYNDTGEGLPFFQGKTEFGTTYPQVLKYTTKVTKEAKVGDILFTVRAPVGEVNIANTDCCIGRGLAAIRPKEDNKYLYYKIQSDKAKFLSKSSGVIYDSINKDLLNDIELKIHDSKLDRDNIGSLLWNYDCLIQNNLRRIELLEESARLLYREWFVHLRFPGHEHTKITNGVPEGWDKVPVKDLCEAKQGYAFKGKDFLDDATGLVLVRMGNFKIGGGTQFIDNTKYLPEGYGFKEKYKLQPNDLVMVLSDVTRDGRIIGNVGFIPEDDKSYILNQRVAKIDCDLELKILLYSHFNSKLFKDFCLGYATSATVLNLSNHNLYKHELLKPDNKILSVFNDLMGPIIKQIDCLSMENIKLKQARDILLPRLMNGDIAV